MADIHEADVIQGDTGPVWHIGVPNLTVDGNLSGYETLTGYTCTLVYTDSNGDQQTRAVTQVNTNNDRFLVQLTSAESQALAVGLSRIVCQVKDGAGTPYRSEVQIDLTVAQQRYSE